MARIIYIADTATGPVTFDRVDNRNQSKLNNDSWGYDGSQWVKITRVIEYKSAPSRHECDDRCMNATGRIMKCECACGGKNHGRAAFNCEAA